MEVDDSISNNNVYLVGSSREEDPSEQEITSKRELPSWTKSSATADDENETECSDWTLDVYFNNNDNDVVSYSIHRFSFVTQSEYFKSIFRLDTTGVGFSESHQKCSTIKLPAPVVTIQHFETLLDYLYTGKLKLNDTNAVSMVYFGDYFGINLLKEQAQRFLRRKIDDCKDGMFDDVDGSVASELLAKFYRDANSLAMEDLLNAIAYSYAHRPKLMSKDTALSKIPDIHFWCRVFAAIKKKKYSNDDEAVYMSELCSINLANFIKRHPDIVDVESFNILTESNSLPNISAKAAIILMEYEQNLSLAEIKNGGDDLTCLQQRCIDALVDSKTGTWNVANPRTLLQGNLRKLQPSVLESLLLRIMDDDKEYPQRCPDYIKVVGAGTESVNGMYFNSGLLNEGRVMFTRRGIYKGRGRLFSIFMHRDKYFYISLISDYGRPASSEDVDLYRVDCSDEFPPDTGWIKCPYGGVSPLPTCRYGFTR
jgi:hypothetical protein